MFSYDTDTEVDDICDTIKYRSYRIAHIHYNINNTLGNRKLSLKKVAFSGLGVLVIQFLSRIINKAWQASCLIIVSCCQAIS